jgi:hypothetical protein
MKKYSALLIFSALLFALPAFADGSSDTFVQIAGSVTLVTCFSATNCGGTETFTESYVLDETNQRNSGDQLISTLLPGSMAFSASGVLGSDFSLSFFSPGVVDWTDPKGDLIQLTFADDIGHLQPTAGDNSGSEFFFAPGTPEFGPIRNFYPGATVTAYTPPVPEPSPLFLLLASIPFLLLIQNRNGRMCRRCD